MLDDSNSLSGMEFGYDIGCCRPSDSAILPIQDSCSGFLARDCLPIGCVLENLPGLVFFINRIDVVYY